MSITFYFWSMFSSTNIINGSCVMLLRDIVFIVIQVELSLKVMFKIDSFKYSSW